MQPILNNLPLPAPTKKQQIVTALRRRGNPDAYTRYRNLPLRYAGGKSLAVGHILARMPDTITTLVSPFMGGGAIEIACARELGLRVHAYDIFDILVNYWQRQLKSPRQLAEAILQWRPDKSEYAAVKTALKRHWTGDQPITDRLSLAAHYWFNHNLSYGPGFLGWMSSIYANHDKFHRAVQKVRDFSCPTLSVRHAPFPRILPKHGDDFLYCDPPYYLDGDSKMFRGIYPQRNFPVHHNNFDHQKLADLLKAHRGGFILSYNDCQWIRDAYAWCDIQEVRWQYTMGQGETRIGKNRTKNGDDHIKPSHELLIIG